MNKHPYSNKINYEDYEFFFNSNRIRKSFYDEEILNNNLNNEKYFYKDKIIFLTEELLNDKFINNDLKEAFNKYVKNLIYFLKNEQIHNILQHDYEELTEELNTSSINSNLDSVNDNLYDQNKIDILFCKEKKKKKKK